jgi:hypothetical protein
MYKFDEINNLKGSLSERDHNRDDKFNQIFNEALQNVSSFNSGSTYNKIYLKKVVELLLEAIKIKNNSAESYSLLAYAMYVLDQDSLALKYLKAANSIDPGIVLSIKLQELLGMGTNFNSKQSTKSVNNSIEDKSPVNKITTIRRLKKL